VDSCQQRLWAEQLVHDGGAEPSTVQTWRSPALSIVMSWLGSIRGPTEVRLIMAVSAWHIESIEGVDREQAGVAEPMAESSIPKDHDSLEIDEIIRELHDWRGTMLSELRALIKQAVPGVHEELKWRKPSNPHGVPTWSHNGPICTGETYKKVVKLTFFKGASLGDPSGLFNASLEGNTRRAIDFGDTDEIDQKSLVALIQAAARVNDSPK
jgi:hypothetical protein